MLPWQGTNRSEIQLTMLTTPPFYFNNPLRRVFLLFVIGLWSTLKRYDKAGHGGDRSIHLRTFDLYPANEGMETTAIGKGAVSCAAYEGLLCPLRARPSHDHNIKRQECSPHDDDQVNGPRNDSPETQHSEMTELGSAWR